jgi:hypothetical protein
MDQLFGMVSTRWLAIQSVEGEIYLGVPTTSEWSEVPQSLAWSGRSFRLENDEFVTHGYNASPFEKAFKRFGRHPSSGGIIVPDWFLVLLSAALAVALWLPWRFSLRTFLIATTLAAVLLGAIVYRTR